MKAFVLAVVALVALFGALAIVDRVDPFGEKRDALRALHPSPTPNSAQDTDMLAQAQESIADARRILQGLVAFQGTDDRNTARAQALRAELALDQASAHLDAIAENAAADTSAAAGVARRDVAALKLQVRGFR